MIFIAKCLGISRFGGRKHNPCIANLVLGLMGLSAASWFAGCGRPHLLHAAVERRGHRQGQQAVALPSVVLLAGPGHNPVP